MALLTTKVPAGHSDVEVGKYEAVELQMLDDASMDPRRAVEAEGSVEGVEDGQLG
jgi:hypothetical protein